MYTNGLPQYGYNPYADPTQFAPSASPIQNGSVRPSVFTVSAYEEMSAYPMAPNSTVDFLDMSHFCLYRKMTDAAGVVSVKIFDINERKNSVDASPEYVTKKDLDDAIKSLRDDLSRKRGSRKDDE